MDTLSHTLWGAGLFGKRGMFLLAMFFGALPDLFSLGLWLPSHIAINGFERPDPADIPDWVVTNYTIFHSWVIAFIAIGAVFLWRKDIAFVMLAWPFHILLDMPFHTAEFFPTQIFWPVSDVYFDGIPWSNPWIWFPNVGALVLLYLWRWRRGDFRSRLPV
ncbi:hypothetical protein [Thiomicrorhabdus sp.]|uniref:hypothetical protein n=1 Tax=Thiomicrorhabdus sp. TaxID=2039724 RepID=UPI0029C97A3E|nr:hypothetical protein [Thiomicrorhabdus sp.]